MKSLFKTLVIGILLGQTAWGALPPTATKGSTDASNVTTFNTAYPGRALTHNGVTAYVPTPPGPGKTYVPNGDFEANVTTGWTLCNTTLTGVIPTGSITNTASSFSALSVTSTSPLAGAYSLAVASGGATTAGQGFCSSAFTIDSEDSTTPRVQTIRASYSGLANQNFSGTSSNTWAIYVYDVTNSVWIQPQGVYNFIGDGKLVATFQPNSTSSSYRLVFLNVNASSGAIATKFDSITVGPQAVAMGPAMTDATSYTMTVGATTTPPTKGTTTIDLATWRRDGDYMEIAYNLVQTGAGTAGSGTYLFPLPSGFSIDTTKQAVGTGIAQSNVGYFVSNMLSGLQGSVMAYNSTNLALSGIDQTTSLGFVTNSYSLFTSGSGVLSFRARVPLAGWSSNSSMSADTDTRVVAASCYASGAQTPGANAQINFDTKYFDTHSAVTTGAGAWKFTAPVSGIYDVLGMVGWTSTQGYVQLWKNGAAYQYLSIIGNSTATPYPSFATQIQLSAGDYIDLRTTAASALVGGSAPTQTYVSISRRSGPAVVQASETVAASYYLSASGAPGTNVQINYDTKITDSHAAVTTGAGAWKFTAPAPGRYSVSVYTSTSASPDINLYKNGSAYIRLGSMSSSIAAGATVVLPLLQGDYIDARPDSTASITGGAAPITSYISIVRIGN